MPTHVELIAYNRNDDEIAEAIGADKVIFQTLDDLKSSITDINPDISKFDASCFDGNYITGNIDTNYLNSLISVKWS